MSGNPPTPRLGYRIGELCAATGLGRTKIYALIAAQQLDIVRVGRCTIVTAESVQSLLKSGLDGKS
jgi:excisionase family DNA binding protein